MPDDERRKPIDIEVCRSKVKVTTLKNRTKLIGSFLFLHDILRTKCRIQMKLGTHMPDGERGKPIDIEVCRSKALSIHIEVCRTKVKVTTSKNRKKNRYFFCFRTIS
jgi:hypothetical protein